MVFSNLVFLYCFLPLNLLLYFAVRSIWVKNAILIAFSVVFYAWGEPFWILLLLLSTFINYLSGRLIEPVRGTARARHLLVASVCYNLGMLILFKYTGFLVENLNLLGLSLPVPQISLPIGISFYTFQAMSYVIDVYRGDTPAQSSYAKLLLYISLFPQLVAGPIVRYVTVAAEIEERHTAPEDFFDGMTRFCTGLGKKVLFANTAGELAAKWLDGDLSTLSVCGAWVGILLFSLQIYYDFSAYSDMAIGLGRIFGFHYLENFDYPYLSQSATEFWRRWHISLSTFFRDYLYIPLGGNRRHHLRNLIIVWFLTGLWHGASWNFVLWGLWFGLLLIVEKRWLSSLLSRLPRAVRHLYLIFVVMIGWTLFYFTDFQRLVGCLGALFGIGGRPFWDVSVSLQLTGNLFWLIAALICCLPVGNLLRSLAERFFGKNAAICLRAAAAFGILLLSTTMLVGLSYNPFLYYRF